ncbi:MAG: putative membrane protein [Francisella sp.]|jgi:uncharacterized membrane protein
MTTENKNMSFTARLIHMLGFEIFGILIFTPFAMLVLNESIFHIGVIAILISLMAMVWNFIYNYIFDLVESSLDGHRSTRKISMRLLHALLFEVGLLIVTVPLVAYWLEMNLVAALLVDIGFVVFYLVYAFFYNYIFDKIYFTYFV